MKILLRLWTEVTKDRKRQLWVKAWDSNMAYLSNEEGEEETRYCSEEQFRQLPLVLLYMRQIGIYDPRVDGFVTGDDGEGMVVKLKDREI